MKQRFEDFKKEGAWDAFNARLTSVGMEFAEFCSHYDPRGYVSSGIPWDETYPWLELHRAWRATLDEMELTEYDMKDSGQREQHPSGAVRDIRTGKGRYDLISPLALHRLAIVYEKGAVKYADRNWEKGMNLSRYIDSALRHTNQALEGRTDEDHLAQATWNLFAAMHMQEMIKRGLQPKELHDLPNYVEHIGER